MVSSSSEGNFGKEANDEGSESEESEADQQVCIDTLFASAVKERDIKIVREDNTFQKLPIQIAEKPQSNKDKQAARRRQKIV